MQIEVTVKQKIDVKTLHVEAGARYWEDATVNGVEDEEGELIPFRDGDYWKPVIELETGKVIDWPKGTIALIHYKVCDDGTYMLKGENGEEVKYKGDYVPNILSPKENGYGDYIIMDIDENGFIQNWKADLSGFVDDED